MLPLPENDISVSFEFFPPKTEKTEEMLWESLNALAPLSPAFVSVTYGAGGTTRERTHKIVTAIQKDKGLKAAAHLTCIGATRGEIDAIARAYWDAGIRHIVALRGDMPEQKKYVPTPGGYDYASDLVGGLKKIAPFEITVAGYPEKHPEAVSAEADLDYLKRKVDAGASRVVTQFFMEPETFLSFRDKAADAGIDAPIVPGMLPITNYAKTVEFAGKCGARIPGWMETMFKGADEKPEERQRIAAALAAEQCRVLYRNGVRDFHFYTLNRAELVLSTCQMLGMRAAPSTH